jgi:hypothetical protein
VVTRHTETLLITPRDCEWKETMSEIGFSRSMTTRTPARASNAVRPTGGRTDKDAEAMPLGTGVTAACPWTDLFAGSIARQIALPMVRGTHAARRPR